MQLSKMKWYILLPLHPIHFLESTTCKFFYPHRNRADSSRKHCSFCFLFVTYYLLTGLTSCYTSWTLTRTAIWFTSLPNLSLSIALKRKEKVMYTFRDVLQNFHRHLWNGHDLMTANQRHCHMMTFQWLTYNFYLLDVYIIESKLAIIGTSIGKCRQRNQSQNCLINWSPSFSLNQH